MYTIKSKRERHPELPRLGYPRVEYSFLRLEPTKGRVTSHNGVFNSI